MKICLVTTFPPSTGGLSEYRFHIAQELQRNPFLSLTVLADELPARHVEPEGFSVVRCWSFDDPRSVFRILRELHRLKPDVVWFNLLFSTFGRNPIVAFSGLMTPLLARLSGRYTHVTLHHLIDTVELKDVGVQHETVYRFAGAVATRMLLLSNSVSVLMPGYRKILNDKYGRDNVHLRAHGILARRPEFPDFSRRGNPIHRILAFGKWGTYKRLELMLEAFDKISREIPEAKLIIAGGDHPQARGYTESVRRRCAGDSRIEFRGYIPEGALADLFQSATVAVMPYSSSTGCSGVAHLACAYGVPMISADIPDFRQMALGEELAIEFYPPGNAQGLADCLLRLLNDIEKQGAMATQNFSAALRMTMPNVVQKYLRHFELQQRVQTLRHISRFRRLPSWVPSKSLMLRFMTRNSLSWARRSVILHAPWSDLSPEMLLNRNSNGRGKLPAPRASVDSNHASARRGSLAGGNGSMPATRYSTNHGQGENAAAGGRPKTAAVQPGDAEKSKPAKGEDPVGEKENSPWVVVRGSGRNGGDREDGTRGTGAGDDGTGR